ncbi:MAG: ligase-associated DNA damage response endonuclease PdeM [Sphingomonadaceae bacterium]
MPPLHFAGQDFAVAGGTALYWPSQAALIVADLHLEKASWFAVRGQMLPPYDSHATLQRLSTLIAQTHARQLWCLGDNFHDDGGEARLSNEARHLLADLMARCDWHWITGNHDEHLPPSAGGTIHEEVTIKGLVLRHQANAADPRPELSGHFHPKYRAGARGQSVSRPCFVASATKLILPAFGAFTGGLSADHPEIVAAAGLPAKALIPAGLRLLSFSL